MSRGAGGAVALTLCVGLSSLLAPAAVGPAVADDEPPAPRSGTYSVLDYGAVGNGSTDDTGALRRALSAATSGATIVIPQGKVFRHTGVLSINRAGVRVTGGGTLLATNEEKSSVVVNADRVTVDHLTLAIASTTKRWETYDQMKLRLSDVDGVRIDSVNVAGSAAAGVYVGGATNFVLRRVRVSDTQADGIHITESSRNGVVDKARVDRPGDDGVAVVSYANGGVPPVRNIQINSPRVYNQRWGRAFSVVGGDRITWRKIGAKHSSAASLYIASEGNYNTQAATNIKVLGGTIDNANDTAAIDHGAVLIYNGNSAVVNRKITIKDLKIRNTRVSASRTVAVLSSDGGQQKSVTLSKFRISGRPAPFFSNMSGSAYKIKGWTYQGRAFKASVADIRNNPTVTAA